MSAGTSAGAILATYFASRGRHATEILSEQGLAEQGLRAGSAQAAVQVFLCRAAEIFPQPQNILSAIGFQVTTQRFGAALEQKLAHVATTCVSAGQQVHEAKVL